MVRAGRGGKFFEDFREKGFVAIGWHEPGDVSNLQQRDAFVGAVRSAYPGWKEQALIVAAGQIYRFWREIREGDRVTTYDPAARSYLSGTILGMSEYDFNEQNPDLQTKRKVQWRIEKSRDDLSTPARNTLGSTLTLFSLPPTVSDELWGIRSDEASAKPLSSDEAVLAPSPQTLSDNDVHILANEVIKDRIAEMDWDDMQELVAGMLRAMGYKTVVSPPGSDRGKDIVASPDGFGFEEPKIIVEVKHRTGQRMSAADIRSFLGGRHPREKGLYVSTGGFTKEAYYEADRAQIPLTLIDFERLVETILNYYSKFDEATKQLLPLRQIYWPIGK